jgi:hypothetical protein
MSQDKAFISFDDAMRMRERHHYGVSTLFGIFLVDGVEIKDDFSIEGSAFGEEFSDWSGVVSQSSTLFSDEYFPFAKTGTIIIDFFKSNSKYMVSLFFEQRGYIGCDFVCTDILAHTPTCNMMWCDKCMKENVMDAMRYCNNMG